MWPMANEKMKENIFNDMYSSEILKKEKLCRNEEMINEISLRRSERKY